MNDTGHRGAVRKDITMQEENPVSADAMKARMAAFVRGDLPCAWFQEWNELIVSGKVTSHDPPYYVKDLRVVAATVYTLPHPNPEADLTAFKVWPVDDADPKLPADHGGKLWFNFADPDTDVAVLVPCRDQFGCRRAPGSPGTY